ncbi:MAG: hypothetical protein HRU17_06405 [Polyangiaceae bacterium]|nr:hypothetical protein [Polyangiaceae bacterium]
MSPARFLALVNSPRLKPILLPQGVPKVAASWRLLSELLVSCGGDAERVIDEPNDSVDGYLDHLARMPFAKSDRESSLVVFTDVLPLTEVVKIRAKMVSRFPRWKDTLWFLYVEPMIDQEFAIAAKGLGSLTGDLAEAPIWTSGSDERFLVLSAGSKVRDAVPARLDELARVTSASIPAILGGNPVVMDSPAKVDSLPLIGAEPFMPPPNPYGRTTAPPAADPEQPNSDHLFEVAESEPPAIGAMPSMPPIGQSGGADEMSAFSPTKDASSRLDAFGGDKALIDVVQNVERNPRRVSRRDTGLGISVPLEEQIFSRSVGAEPSPDDAVAKRAPNPPAGIAAESGPPISVGSRRSAPVRVPREDPGAPAILKSERPMVGAEAAAAMPKIEPERAPAVSLGADEEPPSSVSNNAIPKHLLAIKPRIRVPREDPGDAEAEAITHMVERVRREPLRFTGRKEDGSPNLVTGAAPDRGVPNEAATIDAEADEFDLVSGSDSLPLDNDEFEEVSTGGAGYVEPGYVEPGSDGIEEIDVSTLESAPPTAGVDDFGGAPAEASSLFDDQGPPLAASSGMADDMPPAPTDFALDPSDEADFPDLDTDDDEFMLSSQVPLPSSIQPEPESPIELGSAVAAPPPVPKRKPPVPNKAVAAGDKPPIPKQGGGPPPVPGARQAPPMPKAPPDDAGRPSTAPALPSMPPPGGGMNYDD